MVMAEGTMMFSSIFTLVHSLEVSEDRVVWDVGQSVLRIRIAQWPEHCQ